MMLTAAFCRKRSPESPSVQTVPGSATATAGDKWGSEKIKPGPSRGWTEKREHIPAPKLAALRGIVASWVGCLRGLWFAPVAVAMVPSWSCCNLCAHIRSCLVPVLLESQHVLVLASAREEIRRCVKMILKFIRKEI
jgi:hypothetical protein